MYVTPPFCICTHVTPCSIPHHIALPFSTIHLYHVTPFHTTISLHFCAPSHTIFITPFLAHHSFHRLHSIPHHICTPFSTIGYHHHVAPYSTTIALHS